VWERLCSHETADLNIFAGPADPDLPDTWTPDHILRPEFLETVHGRHALTSPLLLDGDRGDDLSHDPRRMNAWNALQEVPGAKPDHPPISAHMR
jgi:hypothetical protein